jgi:hypothetical protein
MTFVTGTAAAPWIAAAIITRDPVAVFLAIGWCFGLAVSLVDDWRSRVRQS